MNSIGHRGPHRGVGSQITSNRTQQHQNGRNVTRITSPYGNKSIPTPQQPSKAKSGVGKIDASKLRSFDLVEIRREAPKIFDNYRAFVSGKTDRWSFTNEKENTTYMIVKNAQLKIALEKQYLAEGIGDGEGNIRFHPTKGEKLVTLLAVRGTKATFIATL